MRRMSARARWAVPAGVVAAAGVIIAASAVASASVPALPAQTVAQLLAKVQSAAAGPASPMTATVQETANLGLPALPQAGEPGQSTLLSGTTTFDIWYLNPLHVRVAERQSMAESDLRINGTQLWLWDSQSQTATHVLLPEGLRGPGPGTIQPSAQGISRLLATAGKGAAIGLGPNATVAGRAAYQISITPKASGSLVGQILIAIDASRYIPLRVEVLARGSSSPAFTYGYTALSFGAPALSNFSFTPPHGATVKTVTIPASPRALLPGALLPGLGSLGSGPVLSPAGATPVGPGVPGVPVYVTAPPGTTGPPPGALKALDKRLLAHLPKGMTAAQRAAAIKALKRAIAGSGSVQYKGSWQASTSLTSPLAVPSGAGLGKPQVLGSGWTTVVVTPASPAVAAAAAGLLSPRPGPVQTGPVALGPDLAVIRALLRASTPVRGAWGNGRLLRSALLTVLVTSKGQVLAGAVTPAVLYADAATASR
jgi:outer membrane lipoprotein-sorting protein